MSVSVTGFDHIPDVAEQLPDIVAAIVTQTAADVLADAQRNIKANHQIKTGHMLNSGQVEPGENAQTKYVHFAAVYSAYQEMGWRYSPGRPFLLPAVEKNRDGFERIIARIERAASR